MEASRSAGSSSGKRGRDEGEQAGPSKRPARNEYRIEGVVRTRPTYFGFDKAKSVTGGDPKNFFPVKFQTNYFQVSLGTKWTIHKYHTTFEPECLMSRLRNAMIAQHKEAIGGFLFDGVQLFVTRELPEESLLLVSTTRENVEYKIKLVHTSIVLTNQREYLQVLNLILRRATHGLKLQLVNRNYYDPAAKIDLAQHRIELWPGYETSIKCHDAGILLMADIAHKVMRTDTVYDLLQETLRSDPNNFQNSFKQKVLGMTVLTGYNNSTYRIDDVDFNLSPMSKFPRGDEQITIKQYYIEKYRITIRDEKQPLLITKLKEKSLRGGADRPTWLVPELCRVTGLSERQRIDIQLKNAMKPFSQMIPRTRKERILAYNNRVRNTQASMDVITEWNLGLQSRLFEVDGHRLKAETLIFGGKRDHQVVNASWDRECGRGLNLFQPVTLKRWYIVFPNQAERDVSKFIKRITEIGRAMGFEIGNPRERKVPNDRALAPEVDSLVSTKPQMICFVVTSNKNNNADIYSAIKKSCFGDNAIPSQVVTRFILSKDKGYDSVVTKIAIQMCSKLGGAPWSVKIPMGGIMTIGFDVSKDSQNKNQSFGALVATMDLKESVDFFATVASYTNSDSLSTEFGICVLKAINVFKEKHGRLPGKLIIYRSGLGDGDLPYVSDVEVKQLEAKLREHYAECNAQPEFIFIVVSKKINTRIFEGDNNPKAGSVVDSLITMEERMEFFLVAVESRQGTVTPVNYNIIHDSTSEKFGVDKMQLWTYKHTHLYYNWTGTTKVPAVLQYATKLCFMVSNFIHRIPNANLENGLYFL